MLKAARWTEARRRLARRVEGLAAERQGRAVCEPRAMSVGSSIWLAETANLLDAAGGPDRVRFRLKRVALPTP